MTQNRIKNLTEDGFSFGVPESSITALAVLSLKIALHSFVSTYQSFKKSIHIFTETQTHHNISDHHLHNEQYRQDYAETIVHFQHFFELVCKDMLRREHELLALNALEHPRILYRLINRQEIQPEERERLRTIEFSSTIQTVQELTRSNLISNPANLQGNDFIILSNLNKLRNRIWHRGTFVLQYTALDQLVIEFLLPLAMRFTTLPEYIPFEDAWKYETLACNIDPFTKLISDISNGGYNINRAAFWKEMARAAYKSPIKRVPNGFGSTVIIGQNNFFTRESEKLASSRANDEWDIEEILICPVCNVRSLLLYNESDNDDGIYWERTYEARCLCCSLTINHELGNPRENGLDRDDFWR